MIRVTRRIRLVIACLFGVGAICFARQADERVPLKDAAKSWACALEPRATRSIEVSFSAVDRDGASVPQAQLWAEIAGVWSLAATADSAGRFSGAIKVRTPYAQTGLGPERITTVRVKLAILAPELAASGFVHIDTREPSVQLGRVVLDPGGEVTGRLLQIGGAPLVDARVRLGRPEDVPASAKKLGMLLERLWLSEETVVTTRTGANGEYRLLGVPPGSYAPVAHLPSGPYALAVGPPLEVQEGSSVELPDLRVEYDLAESRIRGRVMDPAGNPAQGAWVRLTAVRDLEGSAELRAGHDHVRTDADGRFEAHVFMECDRVELVALGGPKAKPTGASARVFAPSSVSAFQVGAAAVELKLRPTQRTKIRCLRRDGTPVTADIAYLHRAGRGWLSGYAGAPLGQDGEAWLDLPPAPFAIRIVRPEGGTSATHDVASLPGSGPLELVAGRE